MRAAGGAPESQSRVYRLYGLCCAGGAPESGSVRRSGEMGSRDGDGG
jgi:hypothetical protein